MAQMPMPANNRQNPAIRNRGDFLAYSLKEEFTRKSVFIDNPKEAALYINSAVDYVISNQSLKDCSDSSLIDAIMSAAIIGLPVDVRNLAYIIPYGQVAKFTISYRGLLELAYRSGLIKRVYASEVCEKDEFICELGLNPNLFHRPNYKEDRGKIIGVYAVAKFNKDEEPIFVFVPQNDIEKIRETQTTDLIKKGRKPSPAWTNWPLEMAKKVAIRRLFKILPVGRDMQLGISQDEISERTIDIEPKEPPRNAELPQQTSKGAVNPVHKVFVGQSSPQSAQSGAQPVAQPAAQPVVQHIAQPAAQPLPQQARQNERQLSPRPEPVAQPGQEQRGAGSPQVKAEATQGNPQAQSQAQGQLFEQPAQAEQFPPASNGLDDLEIICPKDGKKVHGAECDKRGCMFGCAQWNVI